MTYSIVARDSATGDLGVAVQSKFLSVGSVVPWARAGVGAIATQSYANVAYGPDGLALLAGGASAEEALAALVAADQMRSQRQAGVVDAHGGSATFTGRSCFAWAGGRTGAGYAAQGNILAGAGGRRRPGGHVRGGGPRRSPSCWSRASPLPTPRVATGVAGSPRRS